MSATAKPAILAALAEPSPLWWRVGILEPGGRIIEVDTPSGYTLDDWQGYAARYHGPGCAVTPLVPLPKPRTPVSLDEALAAACVGVADITVEVFRSLLSPEDLEDIAAGGIHRKTLGAYARVFAEGMRSGRIAALPERKGAKPGPSGGSVAITDAEIEAAFTRSATAIPAIAATEEGGKAGTVDEPQAWVGDEDTGGLGTELLGDIRVVFDDRSVDRISSEDLVLALVGLEEYSRGKPLTKAKLARLLRPYGVVSRSVRLPDGRTPKGYLLEQFADSTKAPQARHGAGCGVSENATAGGCGVSENGPEPSCGAGCGGFKPPSLGDTHMAATEMPTLASPSPDGKATGDQVEGEA